jgi:cell division protein FtsN
MPVIILLVLGGGLSICFGAGKRPAEPERIIKRVKIKLPQKVEKTPPIKKAEALRPVKKKPRVRKKPVVKAQKVTSTASKVASKKKKLIAKAGKIDKPWAVHIASYISKLETEKAVKRFKLAGYNAYATEFDFKGVHWYRLRVGFYSSEGDAQRHAKKLSKMFDIKGIWVVRPSTDEITLNIK